MDGKRLFASTGIYILELNINIHIFFYPLSFLMHVLEAFIDIMQLNLELFLFIN